MAQQRPAHHRAGHLLTVGGRLSVVIDFGRPGLRG
jgi:hypothetical protein